MLPHFNDLTFFQYIDLICSDHICQTVGDQKHGLCLSQSNDLLHDIIFTLDINIGGCLIKNIDRAVMQESTRQCQALPLSAGQVGCLFQ